MCWVSIQPMDEETNLWHLMAKIDEPWPTRSKSNLSLKLEGSLSQPVNCNSGNGKHEVKRVTNYGASDIRNTLSLVHRTPKMHTELHVGPDALISKGIMVKLRTMLDFQTLFWTSNFWVFANCLALTTSSNWTVSQKEHSMLDPQDDIV